MKTQHFLFECRITFPYIFMRNDMWDVLQQKLGSSLAFLQLLEQHTGFQIPARKNLENTKLLIYRLENSNVFFHPYLRSQWSSGVNLRLQSRS